MSFRAVVLGSSGGYAGAGKACSGFLLESDGCKLVLDLGAGALSNLLKHVGPDGVDALVVSHMHYDHYSDIHGLVTARRFWPTPLPPLRVMAPPRAGVLLRAPLSKESRAEFMGLLDMRALRGGATYKVGGFKVKAALTRHLHASFSFRVTAEGRTLCYSGDTEPCEALLELARGAHLFICESTLTSEVPVGISGHMFASQAGEIASAAGVGRLLLTHLWPTLDPKRALEDAGKKYSGPLDMAVEGLTAYVGPYPCAT